MGFKWSCPICLETHVYGGKATTKATARCGDRNLKIWQYRILPPLPPKKPPKATNKVITEDLSLGYDFNRSVIIEGLNDTIRIYKNSYVTREGSRVSKKNAAEGKKVLEWVERYENQLSVPLLVTYHPYFVKVLAAYQELKKLRG